MTGLGGNSEDTKNDKAFVAFDGKEPGFKFFANVAPTASMKSFWKQETGGEVDTAAMAPAADGDGSPDASGAKRSAEAGAACPAAETESPCSKSRKVLLRTDKSIC